MSHPVLDGAIQQLPILSKGVVVFAGLLIAAIAGLVVAAMTTSSVVGARTPEVAPEPPIGLVANAVMADRIQLRWQPTDRAELYRVQRGRGRRQHPAGRRRAGRRHGDGREDRPAAHARVLPRGSPARNARFPVQRPAVRDDPRRTAAPTDQCEGHRRGERVRGELDRQRPERARGADRRITGGTAHARWGQHRSTVPAAPGEHCITVLARRGAQHSRPRPSAPPVCVQPAGPSTAAANTSTGGAPNPPRPGALSPPGPIAPSPPGPISPPGPTASSPPGPTGPTASAALHRPSA